MEAIKSVMQRRRGGGGGCAGGCDCADGIIKNLAEEEIERGVGRGQQQANKLI